MVDTDGMGSANNAEPSSRTFQTHGAAHEADMVLVNAVVADETDADLRTVFVQAIGTIPGDEEVAEGITCLRRLAQAAGSFAASIHTATWAGEAAERIIAADLARQSLASRANREAVRAHAAVPPVQQAVE